MSSIHPVLHSNPNSLFDLPEDVVFEISEFLDFSALLRLDASCTQAAKLTQRRWKQLTKKERFNFQWSSCNSNKELYPVKSQYLMGKALLSYVLEKETLEWSTNVHLPLSKDQAQQLLQRFEALMVRYPVVGAVLWKDLTRSGDLASEHRKIYELTAENLLKSRNVAQIGEGGDLLVCGLLTLQDVLANPNNNVILGRSFTYFQKAISKKASCASVIALAALRHLLVQNLAHSFVQSLAENAAQLRDFRGLDKLFTHFPGAVLNFHNNGLFYPPVLERMAYLAENQNAPTDVVNRSYESALEAYGLDEAPASLVIRVADTKYKQGKYEEAVMLYHKAGSDPVFKPTAHLMLASCYWNLKQWDFAEYYVDLLLAGDIQLGKSMLIIAAWTKFKLGKSKEADQLVDKMLASQDRASVCCDQLSDAMFIKMSVSKWVEAEAFIEEMRSRYMNSMHFGALFNCGYVKLMLGKWRDAHIFLTQALGIVCSRDSGASREDQLLVISHLYDAARKLGFKEICEALVIKTTEIYKKGLWIPFYRSRGYFASPHWGELL